LFADGASVCAQFADMASELQGEAIDLVISAMDKHRTDYAVRCCFARDTFAWARIM
jgi:hypothetical protein